MLRAHGRSIHWYLVLSWIIPGLSALAASFFIILGFAWIEFRSEKNHRITQLTEASTVIVRRISNERMLGAAGRPDAVLRLLRDEYRLSSLSLTPSPTGCIPNEGSDFCFGTDSQNLWISRKVPFLKESEFIQASAPIAGIMSRLGNTLFLWSLLPWAFFTLIGLVVQKRFLRRKFMEPMQQLVSVGPQQVKVSGDWPTEVVELAHRLQNTFDDRDAAIFGQTVRGVVHDLRTRLQPLLIATDLAKGAKDGPAKIKTSQFLINCASEVLPKIRTLLDQALDAARGVQLEKNSTELKKTVDSALSNLKELAEASQVDLSAQVDSSIRISHDANQLERAITNLVKNSIEAACENSSQARRVQVAVVDGLDRILLRIEDTGNGFTPEILQAKERGLKVSQSTKHHGIGIGLSSAHQIISAHGGELVLGQSASLGGARSDIVLKTEEMAG